MKKEKKNKLLHKIDTLKYFNPMYPHGKGNYQHKTLYDNIPGYSGYHISKRGNLYSRWAVNGKSKLMKRYHKKKASINNQGRLSVKLSQPGVGTTMWLLSRLVALVYVPNPYNYPFVCHKDNNPLNNNYKNLYWGTQKMNMEQASTDGRLGKNKGTILKGTLIQRSYIPLLIDKGFTIDQISEILNLGKQLIRDYYNKYLNSDEEG